KGPNAMAAAAAAAARRVTPPILSADRKTSANSAPVPMQVTREPLPQLETALARGAIPPRRRDLGHPHAEPVGLDGQLEAELETALRLNADLVEQPLRVEAEVAGRVVHRKSADPMEGKTRRARHR